MSSLDTTGMRKNQARAVEHLADPRQLQLSPRHWGTGTLHPHAGGE
jgi:hypothetical protein